MSRMNPTHRFLPVLGAVAVICVGQHMAPMARSEPVPSLARLVADGRPWKMTMIAEGLTTTLVLHRDGTGRMEGGPMPMAPVWRETAQGLCLKPFASAPERCAELRREGNSIVGWQAGKPQFRLER